MLEKIENIEKRLHKIDEKLLVVGNNYQIIADLGRERSEIEPVVEKGQEYRRINQTVL